MLPHQSPPGSGIFTPAPKSGVTEGSVFPEEKEASFYPRGKARAILVLREDLGSMIDTMSTKAGDRNEEKEGSMTDTTSAKAGDRNEEKENCPSLQVDEQHQFRRVPDCCSMRYILACIFFFTTFLTYSQRNVLNITIVAMVNGTDPGKAGNVSSAGFHEGIRPKPPVYNWNSEVQGMLLSSIFFGCMVTTIPAGYLATVFGGRLTGGIGVYLSTLLTLLSPWAADMGVTCFSLLRALQGISQALVLMGILGLLAKWSPPLERSRLVSLSISGLHFGFFVPLFMGGFISETLGWPSVFYILGGVSCIPCLLWICQVFEDPESHPFISATEKKYITSHTKQISMLKPNVPVFQILKSIPLLAISVCSFCTTWLTITTVATVPTYLSQVFHYNLTENGFLSATPFIGAGIMSILVGIMSDFLLTRNILTLLTERKLFSTLGMLFPSICLALVPFMASSHTTVLVLLNLSMVGQSFGGAGFQLNPLDLAPRIRSTAGLISSP
ncbi:sodium-dependent phosphate transport protein 3-like isoform X2 [Tachyglossus aculeatus]|uniref:sodium-dependent phosphate transport protein 3-like isoform X2 n=1 Tax=Tachyglossus aculeatus TaxID=9261 RepID=UPI0018F316C5|nr:sodium-dependent phosphate transport protein 3-like isoform X2 [Tachyglossus aculeatus]